VDGPNWARARGEAGSPEKCNPPGEQRRDMPFACPWIRPPKRARMRLDLCHPVSPHAGARELRAQNEVRQAARQRAEGGFELAKASPANPGSHSKATTRAAAGGPGGAPGSRGEHSRGTRIATAPLFT